MFTEAIDSRSHYDVSTSHCRKKRELVIGHRERTSLWIWTCLSHNRIAGYHVIKKAEGKRDAVCSLYRYKRDPPKLVMVDFACHAEESGLNWLPEYYKDTRFMHDMFHSYGHVCSHASALQIYHTNRVPTHQSQSKSTRIYNPCADYLPVERRRYEKSKDLEIKLY